LIYSSPFPHLLAASIIFDLVLVRVAQIHSWTLPLTIDHNPPHLPLPPPSSAAPYVVIPYIFASFPPPVLPFFHASSSSSSSRKLAGGAIRRRRGTRVQIIELAGILKVTEEVRYRQALDRHALALKVEVPIAGASICARSYVDGCTLLCLLYGTL
jgi:hypothetical protein